MTLSGGAYANLRLPVQLWTAFRQLEYVTRMQRQWDRRQRFEAKYPELAGDTRPVLAHEGRYHNAPLRAEERRPT